MTFSRSTIPCNLDKSVKDSGDLEVETEASARCHIDGLQYSLSIGTIGNLEVYGVVVSNISTKFTLVQAQENLSGM